MKVWLSKVGHLEKWFSIVFNVKILTYFLHVQSTLFNLNNEKKDLAVSQKQHFF